MILGQVEMVVKMTRERRTRFDYPSCIPSTDATRERGEGGEEEEGCGILKGISMDQIISQKMEGWGLQIRLEEDYCFCPKVRELPSTGAGAGAGASHRSSSYMYIHTYLPTVLVPSPIPIDWKRTPRAHASGTLHRRVPTTQPSPEPRESREPPRSSSVSQPARPAAEPTVGKV